MSSRKENILFLGPESSSLIIWLKECGEIVVQASEIITPDFVDKCNASFLISYGYRHILGKEILEKFPGKAINLHISYLPWNRGADPNFWSFVENTPKGVTIHYLDEGIDTGDIIVQKEVEFDSRDETLATTYKKLQVEIQELFKQNWLKIKSGKCTRTKQVGEGSFHKLKDKNHLLNLVTNGWDTPITELEQASPNRNLVAARPSSKQTHHTDILHNKL
ncbi:MAG: formyltransferase family protein [Chloroflexota bacterium]